MLARFGLMLIYKVVGITLCHVERLMNDAVAIAGANGYGDRCFHRAGHPRDSGIARAHAALAATAWSFCHFFDIVSL